LWRLAFLLIGGAVILYILSGAERSRLQLEAGLSQLLNNPVHIQRVLITPRQLVLRGVSLHVPHPEKDTGQSDVPPFVIDRLQVEGDVLSAIHQRSLAAWWQQGGVQSVRITRLTLSLGGVPLQAQGCVFLTAVPGVAAAEGSRTTTASSGAAPRCEGWLSIEHPLLTARVEVSGTTAQPQLFGWLKGPKGSQRHFVSQWEIGQDSIRCARMEIQGGWSFDAVLSREGTKNASFRRVLWRGLWKLQGPEDNFELDFQGVSSTGGHATLRLKKEDQAPEEINWTWMVHRSFVGLKGDLFGEQAHWDGQVDLRPPYPLEMRLDLKGLNLAELTTWLLSHRRVPPLTGRVKGSVVLKGSPRRLLSKAELFSDAVTFGHHEFDRIAIRFQGIGPMLQIQNSQMARPTGVLLVEGMVDVRRIGQPDFFAAVHLSSLEKDLSLGDWGVGPLSGQSGVQLHRTNEKDQVSVGWDYRLDTDVQPEPVTRQSVRVGYPISSREKVSVRLNKDDEFFGVEHRAKF